MSDAGGAADELVALLEGLGIPPDEVRQAQDDGVLTLLAIDRLALGQEPRYDVAAACEGTGLPEEELRHIWRSLGFPEPASGEPVFTDVDLGNLAAMADLMHSGLVSPEVAYGMTRVIGSSLARVASALVDAVSAQAGSPTPAPPVDQHVLEPIVSRADGFLPIFPAVLEQVWRRHMQVAARRRLLRSEVDEGPGVVVGFADLVGFTALAQQVSDAELAEVVDRFERLAYDVVVTNGGRVVKMIGDEVMFVVDDPLRATEVALGLADASHDAAELSDVRVGMAIGPVVEREGDLFGVTVNLAARATSIAYPGTVVVSPELRSALRGTPGLRFKSMRPRYLKNIGRVPLYVLVRSDDTTGSIRDAIEERRDQMRATRRERLAARSGADDEAAE